MGVYSDILASADSIDVGNNDGRVAIDKALVRELRSLQDRQGDLDYPSGYDAEDEIQSLAVFDGSVTSGNFTLTVTLASGESFTTGNIAYNANAAAIESAIDTAATSASVAGWTNGDISVSGGALTANPVVFTFDGNSVTGKNHPLIVINDVSLSGGTPGDVTATNEGQTKRTAWAILSVTGAISGGPPAQGATPTGLSAPANRESNPFFPSQSLLRALAREAAVNDGNAATETVILQTLGLS